MRLFNRVRDDSKLPVVRCNESFRSGNKGFEQLAQPSSQPAEVTALETMLTCSGIGTMANR